MGKRSDFERVERDFYPTPIEAVRPLVPHLPKRGLFAEPCAGDGRLIRHIETLTKLLGYWMTDIEPMADFIGDGDATTDKIFLIQIERSLVILNLIFYSNLLYPSILIQ